MSQTCLLWFVCPSYWTACKGFFLVKYFLLPVKLTIIACQETNHPYNPSQYLFKSGVARGCGWQHIGAFINLGAFYLCGIPVAATLAFWLQLRGRGLWIGIQTGALLQTTLLCVMTGFTNWEKLVRPPSLPFNIGLTHNSHLIQLVAN